jgi:hypothetical protein
MAPNGVDRDEGAWLLTSSDEFLIFFLKKNSCCWLTLVNENPLYVVWLLEKKKKKNW